MRIAAFAACNNDCEKEQRRKFFPRGICNGPEASCAESLIPRYAVTSCRTYGRTKNSNTAATTRRNRRGDGNGVEVVRAEGKLSSLEAKLDAAPIKARSVWATRAGPRTASRTKTTPIRMATAPAIS